MNACPRRSAPRDRPSSCIASVRLRWRSRAVTVSGSSRRSCRHVERVADHLRLARRERLRRDLRAESSPSRAPRAPRRARRRRACAARGCPRRSRPSRARARTARAARRRVGDLDLDPRVLDVEHAAREAMADEQVADHDVEREPCARGRPARRRPAACQCLTCDLSSLKRAGDVDRRGAVELGLQPAQVLGVAAHRRHPRVAAEEAMRRDRAVLRAVLVRADAGSRSMWQSMQVFLLDLVDAAHAVAGPRRVAPHAGLVEAGQVHRHVPHVGRQEAAMAADAQLGAERLHADLRLVARDRRRHRSSTGASIGARDHT